jgi:hypothetical protein
MENYNIIILAVHNCSCGTLKSKPDAAPVEHNGLVDGVRHEPLGRLRDVLPELVIGSVLLLKHNGRTVVTTLESTQ